MVNGLGDRLNIDLVRREDTILYDEDSENTQNVLFNYANRKCNMIVLQNCLWKVKLH